MNRVTITLHIDLPDGVIPEVDYREAPLTKSVARALEDVPLPAEPPPDLFAEAQRVFADDAATWPAGSCPAHGRPWQDRGRGPFCSGKGGAGPLNEKGYCALKPGQMFRDKRIPAAA